MKNIFLFVSLIFSSFTVFGQFEVKTNNRPDGITLNYINPIPVAIASDYEAGLSLYKNPANNLYLVAITVLFKTSIPKELKGNLLIQTTGNNGISLKPVMNKLINMNGRDIATSMYSLTNRDIGELSVNPIKMLSFNVNNEIIALHLTENKDLLIKEFNLLNANNLTDINKNGDPSLVSESNSSSFVVGLIVIFFILLLIISFIILNKKPRGIIDNVETIIDETSEHELNGIGYNKSEKQINITDDLIKIESNPVNEDTGINPPVESDSSPIEDTNIKEVKRIKYKPSLQFNQVEPYSYPMVKMPKENSYIKFSKKGRSNKLGYTENSFFNELNRYFSSQFKVYNDRHILLNNNYSAYEPDFLLINEKTEKNIFINIEIDEPYDGISRVPTHELNSDVYRDLFFTNRGYIVIRFTEKQIFEEAKQCCVFISNVIKSIDSTYVDNNLKLPDNLTIEKQWDSLQAKKWAIERYRENYLGIEQFEQRLNTYVEIDILSSPIDEMVENLILDSNPIIDFDDNKPLKGNKSHPRDERIVFDPINHRYFIDNNPDTISVSQLIDKFFPEFDGIRAAQNLNPNHPLYGLPTDTILEMWKNKGIEAAELGTNLHKQIENYYKLMPYDANSIEFQYFLNFKEQYRNMMPHRPEWRIFDEDYLLAGTIDMIYEKEDGSYYMFDWKRSEKVVNQEGNPKLSDPAHFYTEFGYGGLNHLTNDSYYKYTLQQNIYRHILETKYGFEVSSMNLLVLHPKYETYHWLQLPKMQDEVNYMFATLKAIS
jgi:hypothetical protein